MNIIFYDLETTGLSSSKNQILEVAAIAIDEKYNIIKSFDEFVKPEEGVPRQITELTGITNEMVKDADSEGIVLERFSNFIKSINPMFIAGHNITRFDNKWIKERSFRYGIKDPLENKMFIDTLTMAKDIAKEGKMPNYNYTTPTGRASYKLECLMDYYHLGGQNHRAIDDVRHNIQVYEKFKTATAEEDDYYD